MIYRRVENTNDYLNMLKRISISKDVTLLVKSSKGKKWSIEFTFYELTNDNLFTLLDLLEYYEHCNYDFKIRIGCYIIYTNCIDIPSEYVESEEKEDDQ
jgi:hypothetical protein